MDIQHRQQVKILPQQLIKRQQAPGIQNVRGFQETPLSVSNAAQVNSYPNSTLGNSWLNLGVELGADLPMFPGDGLDPLEGFDLPFWVGQDNYASWMGA